MKEVEYYAVPVSMLPITLYYWYHDDDDVWVSEISESWSERQEAMTVEVEEVTALEVLVVAGKVPNPEDEIRGYSKERYEFDER